VLDVVDPVAVLDLRVDDADLVLEEGRQVAAAEVAVLVDRGREHRAAVLAVPGGIVGTAPEEGDHEVRLMIMGRTGPLDRKTRTRHTTGVPISKAARAQ
jgi:hypothetical protein